MPSGTIALPVSTGSEPRMNDRSAPAAYQSRRWWLPFAAGLLLGAAVLVALVWADIASLRIATWRAGDDRVGPGLVSLSPPPAVPSFPERVLGLPNYNGGLNTLLDSTSFFFNETVQSRYTGVTRVSDIYRHRSLQASDDSNREAAGLVEFFLADAQRKGWSKVDALTVDGVAAYQTAAVEQDGYVVFIVALADAYAIVSGNPGASMDISHEIFDCPEVQEPRPAGQAPCDAGGFVPVMIWTNLPDDIVRSMDFAPRVVMRDNVSVWSKPWTWAELERVAMPMDGL